MSVTGNIGYDIAMEGLFTHVTHRHRLETAKKLALLLDSSFEIPGTKQKIGLDSLLGLAPVVGDVVGLGLSLYIVYLAREMGMSRTQLGLMLLNIGLDTVIGSVPVLGDVADMFWKANLVNTGMMEQFLKKLEAEDAKTRLSGDVPPGMQTIDVVPAHPQKDKS